MLRQMALSVLSFMVLTSVASAASELDHEASVTNEQVRLAKELPTTVVVRTHLATGRVDILHVSDSLPGTSETQANVVNRNSAFEPITSQERVRGELDENSSTSSWYFYFYNSSYAHPTYTYYGYTYRYFPYYNFWWGGYSYSYYRWYW
ncbi:MAG: hypothetical protein NDI61_06325 [Bdellovibrionaceae bacterium]|nr:hypothetical protein [Pseudobdellovibrionaceae bacterium]